MKLRPIARYSHFYAALIATAAAALSPHPAEGLAPQKPSDAPALAFEVASVKPSKSGAQASIDRTPGRLVFRSMPLRIIIRNAYRLFQDINLQGGPGWVDTECFDIVAKTDSGATKEQTYLMLQGLLADRFKLELHHETREMPAYTLEVAKGGPKLRDLKDMNGNMPAPHADMSKMGVMGTTDGLASFFSAMFGRPVIDKTGITGGRYYLMFEVPKEDVPTPSADSNHYIQSTANGAVFGAIKEQLGLKLVAGKAPVEVLVIDHIERPSEN